MADAAPPAQTGTVVTTEQAGRLLMITPERVRQLIKAGYIKRAPKGGGVPLVGAVQGYITFLKDDERRTTKTAADSRVRDARAREIEIRTAERERTLIPYEDAVAALDIVVGKVRSEIVGLPAKATRDMTLRRTIEKEVDDSLCRIAGSVEEAARSLETGGGIFDAEPEGSA